MNEADLQQLRDDFASLTSRVQAFIASHSHLNTDTATQPPEPAPEPEAAPIAPSTDKLTWGTQDECRASIRIICGSEGLNGETTIELLQTVHCESDFDIHCVHKNVVGGKVTSTDYGIAQVNDFYHIGQGKDFATIDDAMNPEKAIRWMARMFKAGQGRLWVCKLKGLSNEYTP